MGIFGKSEPHINKQIVDDSIFETFGTTDLDYVFNKYMSLETRKKIENKVSELNKGYIR